MIKAKVGISQKVNNSHEAGYQATLEAINNLGCDQPNILIAFSSIKYDQKEVLRGIRKAAPGVLVVGGSAAGEITSEVTLFDAVSVMAICSDQISFVSGYGDGVAKDSFKAGAMAAEAVIENNNNKKPDLFIMFPDGMTGNGAAIVEGVKSVLGQNFPIVGGSLGDDYLFQKTWEYYNDEVLTDAVVGLGLSGDFSYGFGIKHGWDPVGLAQKVTKADGAVIKELDNEPALKIYEDYFGKEASELTKEPLARMAYTYPLGVEVEGSDELLIRDPIVANKQGEITMAAAIPEGTMVRLMLGDKEKAIKAAEKAATVAFGQLEGKTPKCIIMFNCMARNKLLGARCNEENQKVLAVIGKDVPMIGFYTYGEQGPLLGKKNTPAYFHNETMCLLVIGE